MIVSFIIGCILLITALLPFWRNKHWIVRDSGFARIQLFFIGFLLIGITCFFIRSEAPLTWLIILPAAAATLIHGFTVLPYTPFWPKQVKSAGKAAQCFTIMGANVLQSNQNHRGFMELVSKYDPDVLCVLECNQDWMNDIHEVITRYAHHVHIPLENRYGMLLLSKFELSGSEVHYLTEPDIPSIFTHLKIGQHSIRLICAHPTPPSPTERRTSRQRDLELLRVAKIVSDKPQPTIVCGDLNDVAWSFTTKRFIRTSGLKDPRIGRGFYNSFNAFHWWMRFPVDHLFLSDDFKIKSIARSEAYGSDHFAMLYQICMG